MSWDILTDYTVKRVGLMPARATAANRAALVIYAEPDDPTVAITVPWRISEVALRGPHDEPRSPQADMTN